MQHVVRQLSNNVGGFHPDRPSERVNIKKHHGVLLLPALFGLLDGESAQVDETFSFVGLQRRETQTETH